MRKSKFECAVLMSFLDDTLSFYKDFDTNRFYEIIEDIKFYLSNSDIDIEEKKSLEYILKKYI